MNNHGASLWKRAQCQSHFFNRLRLYIESIMLKYLCIGSCFVQSHSLPMNIINVIVAPSLPPPNFKWTELGLNWWEVLFKGLIWALDQLLSYSCWVFVWLLPVRCFLSVLAAHRLVPGKLMGINPLYYCVPGSGSTERMSDRGRRSIVKAPASGNLTRRRFQRRRRWGWGWSRRGRWCSSLVLNPGPHRPTVLFVF